MIEAVKEKRNHHSKEKDLMEIMVEDPNISESILRWLS